MTHTPLTGQREISTARWQRYGLRGTGQHVLARCSGHAKGWKLPAQPGYSGIGFALGTGTVWNGVGFAALAERYGTV